MHETLSKNPIREALIDIKYTLDEEYSEKTFLKAFGIIEKDFPTKEKQIQFEGSIGFQTTGQASTNFTGKEIGALFKNESSGDIIQIRANGYTHNRISKYNGWKPFAATGLKYWEILKSTYETIVPTRIGLRYVNAIPVPPKGDLNEYLTKSPSLPIDNTQISGLFSRISFLRDGITGIISTALEVEPTKPVSLILDIDVFQDIRNDSSNESVADKLEELRSLKNDLFFASITNQLRESLK